MLCKEWRASRDGIVGRVASSSADCISDDGPGLMGQNQRECQNCVSQSGVKKLAVAKLHYPRDCTRCQMGRKLQLDTFQKTYATNVIVIHDKNVIPYAKPLRQSHLHHGTNPAKFFHKNCDLMDPSDRI